jgi:hypothetical protein
VRTTLTLDPDVAARVKQAARRSGRPFKQVINELLRAGLTRSSESATTKPFKVEAVNFGGLRAGLSIDNINELLEVVDGPDKRPSKRPGR